MRTNQKNYTSSLPLRKITFSNVSFKYQTKTGLKNFDTKLIEMIVLQ